MFVYLEEDDGIFGSEEPEKGKRIKRKKMTELFFLSLFLSFFVFMLFKFFF